MLCSVPVFAADSADDEWKDWELVSNSAIKSDGLHVSAGGTAQYTNTGGTNFECEFTLQMNGLSKSTKENAIMVTGGTYRWYSVIKKNMIRYQSPNFSTSKKWIDIPFDVGDEAHTYKLVATGNKAELFVDGLFLSDVTLQSKTLTVTRFNMIDVEGVITDFSQKALPSTTTTVKKVIPIEPYYTDFDDDGDYSDWTLANGATIHDGVLELLSISGSAGASARKRVGHVNEWIFEMKLNVPVLGYNGVSCDLRIGEHYVTSLINPERNTDVRAEDALLNGAELVWGTDEWKVMRVETYDNGTRAVLSFDGVPYMDFDLPASTYDDEIILSSTVFKPGMLPDQMKIDWLRFEPKTIKDKISVSTPMDGAEYLEESDIELSASVADGLDVPSVEYKLHGNTVATGYAPDYKAVLSGASAGNYDITAEYGEYESLAVSFKVKKLLEAKLKVEKSGSALKVSPNLFDELGQVTKAEYYLDGRLCTTSAKSPFDVNLGKVSAASHTISAKFFDKNGVLLCTADTVYTVDVSSTDTESYSNVIKYSITGDSGSADIAVSNGRHSLLLKHTAGKTLYQTSEGEREYEASALGDWEIVTDAYIADVYHNGQLAFSYIMPKTEKTGKEIKENGLKVNGFSVGIPERKENYFLATDYSASGQQTYELSGMYYDYNLDFTAKKDTDVRFAVSDGSYHLDFWFEDGKIRAMDVDNEGMDPDRRYQAQVPDIDGDIYWRAEVGGGFMRLYADGKWITTVRLTRSTAPAALSVKTDSTLGYISVCANEDLYIYSDSFDGRGAVDTLKFWQLRNGTTVQSTDEDKFLLLEAAEGSEGFAEINARTGCATVSATLDLSECEGGAYMVYNHVSNATETRAGYNMETKQFELIKKTRNGTEKQVAAADIDTSSPVKLSVEIDQSCGFKTTTFFVNGKQVFKDTVSGWDDLRGQVGFAFGGGRLKVCDFNYRGDGYPVAVDTEWDTQLSTEYNLIEKKNDEWVLMDFQTKLRSSDYGKTWTNERYTMNMESCHTTRLKSGALLVANRVIGYDKWGFRVNTYRCGISHDDGENWTFLSYITPVELNKGEATCNSLRQGASGRVYFVSGVRGGHDDGWVRVYYSDDEGKTWTEGQELGFSNIGHGCAEAEVMEMSDGEVRLYFRNETGMLIYITSDDYGETWDLTPHKTSLLMTSTHYRLEQDPYEADTIYGLFNYDNGNEHGRDQGPRCRVALVVSYDGGNQWNYVGTLYEEQVELFYATRGSDVQTIMNINVNVARDYVVVTMPYCNETPLENRTWRLKVFTIEKSDIRALAKQEKLHSREWRISMGDPVTDTKLERTIVVSSENTDALVGGDVICGINKNGALPVDILADFLGAELLSKSGSSVTLKQGDLQVKLEGSDVFEADGKVYAAIEAVAKAFALSTCNDGEITVISPYSAWTVEQLRTFKYSLNLFADSDREYVNTNINPDDTWDAFWVEYEEYMETYHKK